MSLTLTGKTGQRRDIDRGRASLLLDFHSPSAALTAEPVLFSARGVSWVVASLVGACFAASALIPIDKVVTAQGQVIALDATSVVQPLDTAIIRSINVHEGDSVKKGQILARLDPTFATADLGALQSQVASLQAEVDRLTDEAKGVDYHPANDSPMAMLQAAMFLQHKSERAFKNENYAEKIDSLQTQVQHALSDVYSYSERLKVASEVEDKRRELERLQVGSQLNRLQATDTRLEIKRGLDGAASQAAQSQRDLQAMKAERDAYNENWRSQVGQDLTDASRKLSDAQENLKKAALRHQLVELRADEDSIVLSVAKVSPGSVMQSGEPLITLVPKNARLEAQVDIAGDDVGFVHPGETVAIKLDTLPYTRHGTLDGVVRVVSPDSFANSAQDQQSRSNSQSKSSTLDQHPLGTAFFRARVSLDASHLRDTPTDFRLTPGMPLVADVKVGKRTLVSYLFARVMPAFENGMREP